MSINQTIVLFTGAGVSAESGIPTFRRVADDDDHKIRYLWEEFDKDEVCNMLTYRQNIDKVTKFYNMFRDKVASCQPSSFHHDIKKWQDELMNHNVTLKVITQNVDDLFERAGIIDVIHVHGEINYMRCLKCDRKWLYNETGCSCPQLNQKTDVVFFHEKTPMYKPAFRLLNSLRDGDFLIVAGTSCSVFPIKKFLDTEAYKIFNALNIDEEIQYLFQDIYLEPCTSAIASIKERINGMIKIICSDTQPSTLNQIYHIDLSNKSIVIAPDWITNCSILTKLDLSSNNLKVLNITLPCSLQEFNCFYNDLDQLCPLPSSLKVLCCSNNKIQTMVQLPLGLEKLYCDHNELAELELVPSLLEVNCHSNSLKTITFRVDSSLPNSQNKSQYIRLKRLNCGYNFLEQIDMNGAKLLKYLNVCQNMLKHLEVPTQIEELYCSNNKLDMLYLPEARSLRVINCSYNLITEVYPPSGLEELYCESNQICQLNQLPRSLKVLVCGHNKLKELVNLPPLLKSLNCLNNKLYFIDSWPSSLEECYCQNNKLALIPKFGDCLIVLDCSNNRLIEFERFPDTLQRLTCLENKIDELPNLPRDLEWLNGHNRKNFIIFGEVKEDVLLGTS